MSTSTPAGIRQIDIGAVLSRVANTYQHTVSVLILGALIVFFPVALLAAALSGSAAGGLVAAMVSLVASVWYSGMVVKAVQDVQDGRLDSTLGELFSSVTPVLGQLILVGLVAGIGIAIGFFLLIVPGLILVTIWSVSAPVVVVESPGVFESLGRSRELVRGNGWQVFGVIVAVFAIIFVVSIVIGSIGAIGDSFLLFFLVQLALNVLIAPVYALAAATLYFALLEARGEGAPAVAPAVSAPAAPSGDTDAFGNPAEPPAAAEPPGGFEPPVPPEGGSTPPPSVPPPS